MTRISQMYLLTGSSGFLGRIIGDELSSSSCLTTVSQTSGDIKIDLSKDIPIFSVAFDVVVHAAGKAHKTPKTEAERRDFEDVNVTGTLNLLKGLEKSPALPGAFLFISSVAVYGLTEGRNISESHPLLARDAYGKSKIDAESLVSAWCSKNNVVCTIFRLPLLAGSNPPGNLGAMIRGIKKGFYFDIAGGKAIKSIVLASDVASIVIKASKIGGIYNLTDGHNPSFRELSLVIASRLNKRPPPSIPLWLTKIIASIGDLAGTNAPINTAKLRKITADLTFDDSQARMRFDWKPNSVIEKFKV